MSKKPEDVRNPHADVEVLETELGVKPGFFLGLLEEGDDWSFVIKIYALVEAALSRALADASGQPQSLKLFTRLSLASTYVGKIAFAEAFEVLDGDELKGIRKLSELRNKLAHDVSNADFTFAAWVEDLAPNQLTEFCKTFGPHGDSITLGDKKISSLKFFKENVRFNIWMHFLLLLSLIYQRKELATLRQKSREDLYQWVHSLKTPSRST